LNQKSRLYEETAAELEAVLPWVLDGASLGALWPDT
jgi:hypothetical protein